VKKLTIDQMIEFIDKTTHWEQAEEFEQIIQALQQLKELTKDSLVNEHHSVHTQPKLDGMRCLI
jgi:hypothetical protein